MSTYSAFEQEFEVLAVSSTISPFTKTASRGRYVTEALIGAGVGSLAGLAYARSGKKDKKEAGEEDATGFIGGGVAGAALAAMTGAGIRGLRFNRAYRSMLSGKGPHGVRYKSLADTVADPALTDRLELSKARLSRFSEPERVGDIFADRSGGYTPQGWGVEKERWLNRIEDIGRQKKDHLIELAKVRSAQGKAIKELQRLRGLPAGQKGTPPWHAAMGQAKGTESMAGAAAKFRQVQIDDLQNNTRSIYSLMGDMDKHRQYAWSAAKQENKALINAKDKASKALDDAKEALKKFRQESKESMRKDVYGKWMGVW